MMISIFMTLAKVKVIRVNLKDGKKYGYYYILTLVNNQKMAILIILGFIIVGGHPG